jgi:alcohol dehydrogenase class IV
MDISNIKFLSLNELKNRLETLAFEAPLIILSRSAEERFNLSESIKNLMSKRPQASRVDNPKPNPTLSYVAERLSSPLLIDGIIAIGGGSALDLGKAINALRHLDKPTAADISLAIKGRDFSKALNLIAVPTTAGTGSEVTSWATVWDDEKHLKYSIDSLDLVPALAWMVPGLTYLAPSRLTLSTGLDALCHATEAYWAKASDPLSRNLALRALSLLTKNLPPLMANLSSEKLRDLVVEGSLLAGLAFSRTRTTACHSISYPLTSMFGVPHGFAAALTLGQLSEINAKHIDLRDLTEIFSPYGGVQAWLDSACESLAPLRLRTFGVGQGDLDEIANRASTQGRIDNNPVNIDLATIKQMLYNIY